MVDNAKSSIPDEVVDIEMHAKEGKEPPRGKHTYRIRVDREQYEVADQVLTGRAILALAGKTPPEDYMLSLKMHGGVVQPIALDEEIDLATPGIERFMTLPLDQTEG
jgi:hypothetical protein